MFVHWFLHWTFCKNFSIHRYSCQNTNEESEFKLWKKFYISPVIRINHAHFIIHTNALNVNSRMHFPNDATLFAFNTNICVYVAVGVRQSKLKCMRHIGRFITSSSQKFIGLNVDYFIRGNLLIVEITMLLLNADGCDAFSIELKAMSPSMLLMHEFSINCCNLIKSNAISSAFIMQQNNWIWNVSGSILCSVYRLSHQIVTHRYTSGS